MNDKVTYFVWDAESIGLYGESFAYGYVVIEPDGRGGYETMEEGGACCAPVNATGIHDDRMWVAENVKTDGLDEVLSTTTLRERFWETWQRWRGRAVMVADCPVPVEADFLARCVRQGNVAKRAWEGAYPFLDVGSIRHAVGLSATESCERLPDEQPEHHPLMDARQSARLLIEALVRGETGE